MSSPPVRPDDDGGGRVPETDDADTGSDPGTAPASGTPPTDGSKSDDGPPPASLRASLGRAMFGFADLINDNIVLARYGTAATCALLAAYGIYRTPLFFRYKGASEIPSDAFARRRTLHGRIVHVEESEAGGSDAERPITCLVRHLSPVGRLQTRAAFDFSAENSPSAVLAGGRLEKSKDLIGVEIAGVKAPPPYSNQTEPRGRWLRRLAEDRSPVSFRLLARRAAVGDVAHAPAAEAGRDSPSSRSPDARDGTRDGAPDPDAQQVAVCRVRYRPPGSFLRRDLGLSLVGGGRAGVASGVWTEDPLRPAVDGSARVGDARADAAYLERLERAEFEAVKGRLGMWEDEGVRGMRPDLVEEAEFEATAGVARKIWRRVRERFGF